MSRIPQEAQLLVGTTIDGYKLEEVAGTGAMGAVYRATDHRSSVVAVKLHMKSDFRQNLIDGGRINKEISAFAQQKGMAAELKHLVRGITFGEDKKARRPYAVTEFVPFDPAVPAGAPARSLQARLDSERRITDPARAVTLLLSVLDGLVLTHAANYLHRDVAARNVLVDKNWNTKLGDFGLAQSITGQPIRVDDELYQKYYGGESLQWGRSMEPPEVKATREKGIPVVLSPTMDIYQLSHLFLFATNAGETYSEAPSKRFGSDYTELDNIVEQAGNEAPGKRFPTAVAMRDAVKTAWDRMRKGAVSVPAPTPQPSPYDRAYTEISDYVANGAKLETEAGVKALTGLVKRAYTGATDAQKRDVFTAVEPAATAALKKLNGQVTGLEGELQSASTALSTARDDSILKRLLGIKSKAEPHLGVAGAYRELVQVFPRPFYSAADQAAYAKLFPQGGK